MGAALLKNPDKVKDVSFSLVVACDLLEAIHMGGGTGCLPGRDAFYPGFKNCLYEAERDAFHPGMLFMRMFLPGTKNRIYLLN